MDIFPSTQEVLVRMVLAALVGGVLGFERQWHRKPAGLRTHMMVSLGAATFTLIALDLYTAAGTSDVAHARLDPLRLVQGLVGGLGFLGAGTIVHTRGSVEGLTTAASIWLTGAIGAACGGGHYVIAGTAMAIAMLVLVGVGFVQHRLSHDDEQNARDIVT